MAYISQEMKKVRAAAIKKIIAEKYADLKVKYTMGITHHSTLRFTIAASTIDFGKILIEDEKERLERIGGSEDYMLYSSKAINWTLNEYFLENVFSGRILLFLQDVKSCLMAGNHNNSDLMTDYFDVGWYITMKIGRWDRPYRLISE